MVGPELLLADVLPQYPDCGRYCTCEPPDSWSLTASPRDVSRKLNSYGPRGLSLLDQPTTLRSSRKSDFAKRKQTTAANRANEVMSSSRTRPWTTRLPFEQQTLGLKYARLLDPNVCPQILLCHKGCLRTRDVLVWLIQNLLGRDRTLVFVIDLEVYFLPDRMAVTKKPPRGGLENFYIVYNKPTAASEARDPVG